MKQIGTNSAAVERVFQKSVTAPGILNTIDKIKQVWRIGFGGSKSGVTQGLLEAEDIAKRIETQLNKVKLIGTSAQPKSLTFSGGIDSTKQLTTEIGSFNKIIEATVLSIKDIPKFFGEAETIIKRLPAEVAKIPASFTGIRDQLKTLSKEIFDLQKAPVIGPRTQQGGKTAPQPKVFDQGVSGKVGGLFSVLGRFGEDKAGIDAVIKSLKNFESITIEVAKVVGGDAKRKIEDFQKLFSAGKFKVDIDKNAFKSLFKVAEESIDKASKTLGTGGKDLAAKLTLAINESVRSGKGRKEVEQAFADLTDLIAAFFPQSPAEKGALRSIPRWGPEIGAQLSQGIKKGTPVVLKSVDDLTENIAKYFPRSPAILGALINLPIMGLKIPFQIAEGMLNGIGAVRDAASKIADVIIETAGRAAETKNIADRFGISTEVLSSFNLALASSGANASDLTFAFQSFQKVLSKTATPEDVAKFENLGISLDKARASNEPFVSLLFQISHGLKEAGAGSEKFGQIIEATGLNLNSNFVNFLLNGPEGLREFQIEAVESGTVLSEKVGKLSQQFIAISNKFEVIKNNFLNGVLEEILPVIIKTGNELLQIFRDNQSTIGAVLQAVAKFFAEGLRTAINFTKFILVEPQRATVIALTLIDSFFKLALKLFDVGFGILKRAIAKFFDNVAPVLLVGFASLVTRFLSLAVDIISRAGGLLGDAIIAPIKAIKNKIVNAFSEAFTDTIIALNELVKEIPGAQTLFEQAGFQLLSGQDIARIQQEQRKARETIKDTKVILDELVDTFDKGTKKGLETEAPKLLEGLVTEEDKAGLKQSLNDVTDELKRTFKEINEKVITPDDINKRIASIGQTFKEGFSKAFSFVFSDQTQAEILGGLGFIRDKVTGSISEIVNSEPAQFLKDLFLGKIAEQKKKIDDAKALQLKAIEDSAKKANEALDGVARKKEAIAEIPLLSDKSIAEARRTIAKFGEDTATAKPLKDLLSEVTKADPFLGLKLSLEALGEAKDRVIPLIQDDILAAFKAVTEKDPFVALRKSLELLKAEAGGLKEKIAGQAFSDAIGSKEFKRQTKRDPNASLDTLSEGFNATSEENIGAVEDSFTAGFQDATQVDPFAALSASFDLFVSSIGEKGRISGELFVGALQASFNAVGSVTAPLAQAFENLFELTGKKSKALFFISKAIAIADATVKGAQAILQAYASVPYPANIAAAISTGALVATQIAAIVGATVKGFVEGGPVFGPGGTDVIPARLTAGEYVQPKHTVDFYGLPLMEAIRNRMLPQDFGANLLSNLPSHFTSPESLRFESGGVGPTAEPMRFAGQQGPPPVIQNNITNIVDPAITERHLASTRGEKQILNIITNNAEAIKKSLGVR
ncbi:MAG: hypothetical protein AABZ60_14430 [Planctomycetota bacterium]